MKLGTFLEPTVDDPLHGKEQVDAFVLARFTPLNIDHPIGQRVNDFVVTHVAGVDQVQVDLLANDAAVAGLGRANHLWRDDHAVIDGEFGFDHGA